MPKFSCANADQHYHDGYQDGYFDGIETDNRNDCCRECMQAYDLGFEEGADVAVSECFAEPQPTLHALDGGESAPLEAESTPEVLSTSQALPKPTRRK